MGSEPLSWRRFAEACNTYVRGICNEGTRNGLRTSGTIDSPVCAQRVGFLASIEFGLRVFNIRFLHDVYQFSIISPTLIVILSLLIGPHLCQELGVACILDPFVFSDPNKPWKAKAKTPRL